MWYYFSTIYILPLILVICKKLINILNYLSSFDFNEISEKLNEVGKNNGVEIHIQLQSIFDAMHQVSTNVNSTPNS